jgi:ribosome-associated protein
VKQVQFGRHLHDVLRIGQARRGVLGREARNVIGCLHGLRNRLMRKIGCTGVAPAMSHIHRHAQRFVAVTLHGFQLTHAHRHAQAATLGGFGAYVGGPQFAAMGNGPIDPLLELFTGVMKAIFRLRGAKFLHMGGYDTWHKPVASPRASPASLRPHRLLMSRKPKKGYFVRGQFVAEGSELDQELRRELKGGDEPSKTELKRESAQLQALGEELLSLRADLLLSLGLPDKLQDALTAAKRITHFEGKRRQMQFIGKLMRQLPPDAVDGIRSALDMQRNGSARDTLALHETEQWRERLIQNDEAVSAWMAAHPDTDSQQLRALVRQARKDAVPEKPGLAPRHARAYRELFQLLRQQLQPHEPATTPDKQAEAPHA